MLRKQKFPVAIPELPLFIRHRLFHPLPTLGSVRKRGFQRMPDQVGREQPGRGDIWNRDITEQTIRSNQLLH